MSKEDAMINAKELYNKYVKNDSKNN